MINAAEIVARAKARGDEHRAGQLALAERRNGRLAQARPVTTADDVARKMASHMRDIAAVRGSVDEDDLLGRGWTFNDIRHHAAIARDLANAAQERRV